MKTNHCHKGKSSESLIDKNNILKHLNITSGQHIIDAGCGFGYMSKEFSRLSTPSGKVYAIDIDKNAIDLLKQETGSSNIDAIVSDTTNIPIASNSIDLIYTSCVLHGFSRSKIKDFASEAQRLLKPDKTLAVLEIKKEDTPFGPEMDIRLSPTELEDLIDLTPDKLININDYFYMKIFTNT